jgi:hypothetical protein
MASYIFDHPQNLTRFWALQGSIQGSKWTKRVKNCPTLGKWPPKGRILHIITLSHQKYYGVLYLWPSSKFDPFLCTPGVKTGVKTNEKGQILPYPSYMNAETFDFAHNNFVPRETWWCLIFLAILNIWAVFKHFGGQYKGQNERTGSKIALPLVNNRLKIKSCA